MAIIGLVLGFLAPKRYLGVLTATATLILSAGGFFLWYQSLYTGENLGTTYTWTSDSPDRLSNLAYSKRTEMSSGIYGMNYPYLFASGRGVDGDMSLMSGFRTGLQGKPWWIIDLHRPELIDVIVIYESRRGPKYNIRPLTVSLSEDQKKWETISVNSQDTPLRVAPEKPLTARYVLIQASGHCHLSFDEVEIYPPAKISNEE